MRHGRTQTSRDVVAGITLALLPLVLMGPPAIADTTTLVSVASDGTIANDWCTHPAVSADGRYVAFMSSATNLVPVDTHGTRQMFVHDRVTGGTEIVSVASDGTPANSLVQGPSISADGRYVAFQSDANNLVPGDFWWKPDVFVHDRLTGQTTMVDLANDGAGAVEGAERPAISADGRYVAFQSLSYNLAPGDNTITTDVFVRDRSAGTVRRMSTAADGGNPDGDSGSPSISADGRYVAFTSNADNLVPGVPPVSFSHLYVHDCFTGETRLADVASDGTRGNDGVTSCAISADGRRVAFVCEADNLVAGDTNHKADVFVHNMETGETIRASVASDGTQGDDHSYWPSISADGQYVAFTSKANNLVPGDTNVWDDVFLHDCVTGETMLMSVASDGTQAQWGAWQPSMSAEPCYVAFYSWADLVPGAGKQIYLRERTECGSTYVVSGKLCLASGVSKADVHVRAFQDGAQVGTSTVDADGVFHIRGLPVGGYDIIPSKPGWQFAPEQRRVFVLAKDVEDVLFTGLPPATAGGSETYWDFGMGTWLGVSAGLQAELGPFGISGAKVGATLGQDWSCRVRVIQAADGHQTLGITPANGANVGLGLSLGPKIDTAVASAQAGFSYGSTMGVTFGREYLLPHALGAGADIGEQMDAVALLLTNFMMGPVQATPGTPLLVNALLEELTGNVGYDELHVVQRRAEIRGEASYGASLSVGYKSSNDRGASLKVAEASLALVASSHAISAGEYVHPEAGDPAMAVSAEMAQTVDVALLESLMGVKSESLDTATNPFAAIPHAGKTGISTREIGLAGAWQPIWVAASYTSDTQESGALFSSQSDAETARLQTSADILRRMSGGYGADMLPPTADFALRNLSIPMGPTALREDFAQWYAALEKYSEDYPGALAATYSRTRDKSTGVNVQVGVGLGLGLGVEVGIKRSASKGWIFTELVGEITNGDLIFAERHTDATVLPMASAFNVFWDDLLAPVVAYVKSELEGLVRRWIAQVKSAADAVAGKLNEAGELVLEGGKWALDTTSKLGAYAADLLPGGTTGSARVVPYSFTSVHPAGVGNIQFQTIVGVGEVRVVRIEDPSGNPITTWPAGDAKLRVNVVASDLTERGIDPALIGQVQLYRFDPDAFEWTVVPTSRDGDVFEADLSQDGEYMPAVGTALVDSLAPEVTALVPYDGANVSDKPQIEVTLADRPTTRNVGIDDSSITLLIDGNPVAPNVLQNLGNGSTKATYTPPAALAVGAHTLQVRASDNLGHEATSAPTTFTVLDPSAIPDLPTTMRGWREQIATGVMPAGFDITGDDKFDLDDVRTMLENHLR